MLVFFCNVTTTTPTYSLSLHDALPISIVLHAGTRSDHATGAVAVPIFQTTSYEFRSTEHAADRKSTRLNSSHVSISYAVFCLKKKKHAHNEQLLAIRQPRELTAGDHTS